MPVGQIGPMARPVAAYARGASPGTLASASVTTAAPEQTSTMRWELTRSAIGTARNRLIVRLSQKREVARAASPADNPTEARWGGSHPPMLVSTATYNT